MSYTELSHLRDRKIRVFILSSLGSILKQSFRTFERHVEAGDWKSTESYRGSRFGDTHPSHTHCHKSIHNTQTEQEKVNWSSELCSTLKS